MHPRPCQRLTTFATVVAVVLLITPWASPSAASPGDALASLDAEGHVVELRTEGGTLVRLTFLADAVVRIQATTGSEPTDAPNGKAPIVLPDTLQSPAWAGVPVTVRELGTRTLLGTRELELILDPTPLRLELRRRSDGRTLWRELKPLQVSAAGTTQTLSSDADERFYGGGQQNGFFQHKGRQLEISYSGGWEEGDRPSPAPFFMSDRGYGMLRNTWTDGVYDFRSKGFLTATHAENRFDAYLLVGDSIHQVLDLYTQLTGRAALLPRWAFGYGDADCYNDGDNAEKPGTVPEGWSDGPTGTTPDVVAMAEQYRRHAMPGSWILPNDGYGCGYTDLPRVVEKLTELGFRTGLWTEDGVEKIAWEVGTAGTRAQKLDVAWTGKGYQFAMDANHDAATGILEHSDSRPFLWTVMGWAGIERYAVTWTGDQSGGWDFIRWHVPTLIGSGLSGMNYSTGDVDGIFGGSPESYTRDLQWKSFTPVLMGMSGWSRTERKHPWWFDEPHRSIHRRYLLQRQRLMPYLYTLARQTETTGAPMVRSISWDHPDDPQGDEFPYQFFLGRDLLVAPVYRSQAASGGWREGVYLPPGRWIDFWDGRVIEAGPEGRVVDIPVDLATVPVLVRSGAIVPLYPESLYDGERPHDPLTLDIYPSHTPASHSDFVLYEDDGDTRRYQDGHSSEQRFTVATSEDARRIEVTLEPVVGNFEGLLESREFVLDLHVVRAPTVVTLDGRSLEDGGLGQGWSFDADDRGEVLRVETGRLDVRARHSVVALFDADHRPEPGTGYPPKPENEGTVALDGLRVVSRPAEEPGHPLENAFDGDPNTWFRTIRDQSVVTGPHELVLSLGGRRVVEGLSIRPRNDRHWKYGQIRDYEISLSDANGHWGEPVAVGAFEQIETEQEVRFSPRAGRLLRLRILSTHDDGADPMVLGATGADAKPYDALVPLRVGPTTVSELRVLEHTPPDHPTTTVSLATALEGAGAPEHSVSDDLRLDGLTLQGLSTRGDHRLDLALGSDWQTLRADLGRDDRGTTTGSLRFQVWGEDRLMWDSGVVQGSTILKPRIDIRGLSKLSLRTLASDPSILAGWADLELVGIVDDGALKNSVRLADPAVSH